LASKNDSKNISAEITAKSQYTSTYENGLSLDRNHAVHSGKRLLIRKMLA
jgi:hypothetical protein